LEPQAITACFQQRLIFTETDAKEKGIGAEGFLISNPLLAELLEAQRPHTVRSLLETGQQLQEKDN